jgi:hypothetical protein
VPVGSQNAHRAAQDLASCVRVAPRLDLEDHDQRGDDGPEPDPCPCCALAPAGLVGILDGLLDYMGAASSQGVSIAWLAMCWQPMTAPTDM